MIERILELMRMKSMTFSQLADTLGVQRSGISHFVSGRNKPSLEFILKILNQFQDVNPDWLLFGKEPVFRNGFKELTGGEGQKLQADDAGISSDEGFNAAQRSFMDELFNETGGQQFDSKKDGEKSARVKEAKPQPSSGNGMRNRKKESSIDEDISPDLVKKEFAERIVIFYKNRTFREYIPDNLIYT